MTKFLSNIEKASFKSYKEIYNSPTISTCQLSLVLSNGTVYNVNLLGFN